MGKKVSVDVRRLREGASALAAGGGDPRGPVIQVGDLGSSRADGAFEEFERYWSAGRSAVVHSTDALVGVLRSAADVYTRRDAESARQFTAGTRAF